VERFRPVGSVLSSSFALRDCKGQSVLTYFGVALAGYIYIVKRKCIRLALADAGFSRFYAERPVLFKVKQPVVGELDRFAPGCV
jgi:hypothetical protein